MNNNTLTEQFLRNKVKFNVLNEVSLLFLLEVLLLLLLLLLLFLLLPNSMHQKLFRSSIYANHHFLKPPSLRLNHIMNVVAHPWILDDDVVVVMWVSWWWIWILYNYFTNIGSPKQIAGTATGG